VFPNAHPIGYKFTCLQNYQIAYAPNVGILYTWHEWFVMVL